MLVLLALLACSTDTEPAGCDGDDGHEDTAEETEPLTKDEFVQLYAEAACDYEMTCGEVGWESEESCEEDHASQWVYWLGCAAWDAELAEACLEAMVYRSEAECSAQVNTEACLALTDICVGE
jgi:hypothetical protein